MAYTAKELTQKYETLWEQVDGLYRETSGLKEYVIDIDSKYDTLWAKCNSNADGILHLKEHSINKSRPEPRVDDHQITSIRFDIGVLQSKMRTFDKMEEDHIAMVSNMSYDMYSMRTSNDKNKDYIDNKIAKLYAYVTMIIVAIFAYSVC